MSNRRNFLPHQIYHIYNRGNRKQTVFRSSRDKDKFLEKIFEYGEITQQFIYQICIMNNHFHMIVEQGEFRTISKFMQRLGTSISMYINKKYSLVGHLFQGRYKTKLIKDRQQFIDTYEYILNNPVKAGLARRPEEYPWLWVNPEVGPLLAQTSEL